ncbi:ras association domain-containing protein 9 isoform X2 [Sinocyclocheilus rhinocerous]|uniref:Ras association domain-containing protein 9-like n=1 Tax=Sinocyclocheilus rhinocerous TaxID=307959 RepID=A0A673IPZ1_9TELE|nr:PREDICTED: ras association domain-containing protein 9-like isoform X1 [Sinocyclocheilus rhinocerous]XP_016396999.1 PREDICTED: ras association domain-containing protein 9-like isoform X2 [Sinocyclocheilus rhinocerous]
MAPFGKNFLKARLKNRSKPVEETPGKEIQVLLCREEKVVCGVTKHTTCADVVKALLEDHQTLPESKRLLHGEPKDFCILERWKGFERALPPLTRILRLWNAWGDERPFIQFVLMKISDFVPSSKGGKRASKSRGARSKRWEQGPAQYAKTVSAEKQKRMVKKAFRKLEKIQTAETSEGSEEISKLVQLIISQDQTIRQQIHQMREIDLEIEHAEKPPRSSITESDGGQSLSQLDSQLQEYLYTSDGLEQLELHACRHQELIDQLSRDIDLELRNWTSDLEDLKGAAAASPELELEPNLSLSSSDLLELESLRSELESSMRAGLSLHAQTQETEKELQQNKTALQSQNQEYQHLVAQLNALELGACPDQPSPVSLKSQIRASVSQQTADKVRLTCSPTDATDTDSDTGISSTHSQDSLSPCVDRSPPLDTDV